MLLCQPVKFVGVAGGLPEREVELMNRPEVPNKALPPRYADSSAASNVGKLPVHAFISKTASVPGTVPLPAWKVPTVKRPAEKFAAADGPI